MLKCEVPVFQHLDIRTVFIKIKLFRSIEYPRKGGVRNFVWIQSIKRTGNLTSHGEIFICNSHFDESCFERYLKIILLVPLCLFKFR